MCAKVKFGGCRGVKLLNRAVEKASWKKATPTMEAEIIEECPEMWDKSTCGNKSQIEFMISF